MNVLKLVMSRGGQEWGIIRMFAAIGIMWVATLQTALATQADSTAVSFVSDVEGAIPFIHELNFTVAPLTNFKSVVFTVRPKPGSFTRAISATYPKSYLSTRHFVDTAGNLKVPVFGLYDGFTNSVTLTFVFNDNSQRQIILPVATTAFSDPCGYKQPTVVQARTNSTSLSYDFMMLKDSCSSFSPAIMDTDGALRWVGTGGVGNVSSAFFDNAVYIGQAGGPNFIRMELDGAFSIVADYSNIGVTQFHHNIDRGKHGLLLEVDTRTDYESTVLEADKNGNLLKVWNMAEIIGNAMRAGGDDPSAFVRRGADWFHNNAATYRASDDSVLISSRESFVIALDYRSSAIKWILGDTSKAWYQYPSLRAYALTVAPGGVAPIGQHAVSITYNDKLLLFDNGLASANQTPAGNKRNFSAPRKYSLDLNNRTATQIFAYNRSIVSEICSSVYEDAPNNYLVDYAVAGGFLSASPSAEIVGLQADGQRVFDYAYPTSFCQKMFNALPMHLEQLTFGSAALPFAGTFSNFSGRALIGPGDNALFGGFVIGGSGNKEVIIRGLGPSLAAFGLAPVIPDPFLTLYSGSQLVATNDNYTANPILASNRLTPGDPRESALVTTLNPGAYSTVLQDRLGRTGFGLLQVYDVTDGTSQLVNVSIRGRVGLGNNLLIGGFTVATHPMEVIVRALGPTLATYGVSDPLPDPSVGVYNADGSLIASNTSWMVTQKLELTSAGFALPNAHEASLLTILYPGAYTAIVRGAAGSTAEGSALLEIYNAGAF